MGIIDILIWIIYPYTVIAIFIMGLIWQYDFTVIKKVNAKSIKTMKLNKIICIIGMIELLTIIIIPFSNDYNIMFQWLKSIILFNPNIEGIIISPIIIKLSSFLFFLLILLLPFSTYIQFISKPIQYLMSIFQKKNIHFDIYNEKPTISSATQQNPQNE